MIILHALSWLWHAFVWFLLISLATNWLGFLMCVSLPRKTRKLMIDSDDLMGHEIPKQFKKEMASIEDGSAHRRLNIMTLVIGSIAFLTFIL